MLCTALFIVVQGWYVEDSSKSIVRSSVEAPKVEKEHKQCETILVNASVIMTDFKKMLEKMTKGGGVAFVIDRTND
jgi:hypothetical protein